MVKLVTLELDGTWEQGFAVSLSIGEARSHPDLRQKGFLPANRPLAEQVKQHWQQDYRGLNAPYRIKPGRISYDGSIRAQRVSQCQTSAQQLAQALNAWLKSESFRDISDHLREFLEAQEEIRFILQTQDPLLHKLPWQAWDWFKRYSHAEPAFSPPQYQNSPQPPKRKNSKVRILAILGHSENIDVKTDRQLLENLPNVEVCFLVEPERTAINEKLWEERWDILFFAGHSETEGEKGRIYINPSPDPTQNSLDLNELWYGISKAVKNGLQVAIFNSCDGLGLASQLQEVIIPQMIIMRELVPDRVAQEFLKQFLTGYANGKSLYVAAREAREKLQGLEAEFPCASWLPVIFQNPTQDPPTWEDLMGKKGSFSWSLPSIKPLRRKGVLVALSLLFGLGLYGLKFPASAYFNRVGVKSLEANALDKAKYFLDWAVRLNPNNANALTNLGMFYEAVGEPGLASDLFQRSKLLGNPWGCNNIAYQHLQDGSPRYAERLLRACWQPMQAEADSIGEYLILKNLGWALLAQNKETHAQPLLEQAIQLEPKEGVANCLLAQVLEAQQQPQLALEHWQDCWRYAKDEYPEEAQWKQEALERLELGNQI